MSARYALYYAPSAGSALHAAVTPLFGRDALNGTSSAPVPPEGSPFSADDWAARVAAPAKYGLHATLKAPFELSPRWEKEDWACELLMDVCRNIARRHEPFATTPLELRALNNGSGAFLALTPSCGSASFGEANPGLCELERDCVTAPDFFRAPLAEADIKRRGTLSSEEAEYLAVYGYHRVFNLFRFHLTLTGSLSEEQTSLAQQSLQRCLSPFLHRPLMVDGISLFRQKDRESPFTELARFPLGMNNHRNIV